MYTGETSFVFKHLFYCFPSLLSLGIECALYNYQNTISLAFSALYCALFYSKSLVSLIASFIPLFSTMRFPWSAFSSRLFNCWRNAIVLSGSQNSILVPISFSFRATAAPSIGGKGIIFGSLQRVA